MEHFDIAVIGGGLCGVAAAVSAARLNKNVILIEQNGSLSGAVGNNLVYPYMPYYTRKDGELKLLCGGIFTEINNRLQKFKKTEKLSDFDVQAIKTVLDEMVTEAGVTVLFHAKLFDVNVQNGKLNSVKLATIDGVTEISADFFTDATGDGEVFYLCGCECRLGRENDNLCQPMTTCFRVANVKKFDNIDTNDEMKRLQSLYKEYQSEGKILNPRENILVFSGIGDGILHFNTTRIIKLNPTNPFDLSKAEIEARKQVFEIFRFLKENSELFKDSIIIDIASSIGVRESRMLNGEYVLTVDEIKNLTKFDDRIALCNYDIDIHNPSGSGTSHYYFKQGDYYGIPYRCLVPKEISNLLVAGRCISVTHEVQASVRIMPVCTVLGQAAGTAAALILNGKTDNKSVNVTEIQNTLRKNGAILEI